MSHAVPNAAFTQAFPPRIRDAIVSALQRAYDTAADHFEPDRGNNEKTFGFEVYQCAVFELAREVEKADDPSLAVASKEPTFRLTAGDFWIGCHRVGRHESESIWQCFPNNEGAAAMLVEAQLWLPGLENAGLEQARTIVIAHLGNPEDGLCAVYLCVPGKAEGGKITAWACAIQIWNRNSSEQVVPSTRPGPVVPDETIEEPIIRKREKAEDEGAG